MKTTQYFVPLGDRIDREAEIAKLGEELTYYEGFLQSVERKLSNERFVQSAPAAVVEKEACQEGRRRGEDRRDPRTAGGVELTAAMLQCRACRRGARPGSCVLRGSTLRTAR